MPSQRRQHWEDESFQLEVDAGGQHEEMDTEEMLTALEESIAPPLEPDTDAPPDALDLVEESIEEGNVSPAVPYHEIGNTGLPQVPGNEANTPLSPLAPETPLFEEPSALGNGPLLRGEELMDPFGRPLLPPPEDLEEELGPGAP